MTTEIIKQIIESEADKFCWEVVSETELSKTQSETMILTIRNFESRLLTNLSKNTVTI